MRTAPSPVRASSACGDLVVDLEQLQRCFYDSAVEMDQGCDDALRPSIVPGGKLTVDGAIDVYRGGYYARLTEALGAAYEAVWRVLGDEGFFDLCRGFIKSTRSRSYNLSDYGEGFAAFLEEHEYAAEFPFLPELAEFEWILNGLFHAYEHSHVGREELEVVSQADDARLVVGSAVVLLETRYSISKIWELRKSDDKRCRLPSWNEPEHLLVYKLEGQMFVKPLSPANFEIVYRLQQGDSLQTAIACVGQQFPDLDENGIGLLFHDLFGAGVISSARPIG